ncbi:Os06g0590550, partial [Oryza sativa Japonica Group]
EVDEHREDEDGDEDDAGEDGDTRPLAAALLVLPRHLELDGAPADEGAGVRDVALDVVELVSLGLDERRHVEEHLVQVEQAALDVLDGVVPLLDLRDGVHHLPPPLLLDRLLQERLALPRLDERIDRAVLRLLPRHRVVPPRHRLLVLRRHPR